MTLYKMVNGEEVALTTKEEEIFVASQPTEEEVLEQVKLNRVKSLEEERKKYQYSPIEFEGNIYEASFTAQSKYFAYLTVTNGDISWLANDNETWVSLTRLQAEGLRDTIINREIEAYSAWSSKKQAVMQCSSEEEVLNINWDL